MAFGVGNSQDPLCLKGVLGAAQGLLRLSGITAPSSSASLGFCESHQVDLVTRSLLPRLALKFVKFESQFGSPLRSPLTILPETARCFQLSDKKAKIITDNCISKQTESVFSQKASNDCVNDLVSAEFAFKLKRRKHTRSLGFLGLLI